MRYCVTQKQMQEIEHDTIINVGIPSIVLMERAALAVAKETITYLNKATCESQSIMIYIVCGKGNNGADGIAVARLLFQQQYRVSVITVGNDDKATSEYKIQENIAKKLGVDFCPWDEWVIQEHACIIDGIFGIGLTREITGAYASLVEKIENSQCQHVIAIDMPSGIFNDTGMVLGCAIHANLTITFEYEKLGLYVGQGKNYAGKVVVAKIGFDQHSIARVGYQAQILEEQDMAKIPLRKEDSNKGTYGRLLVIAGSNGMSGAAYLCAKAAYRCGAGLVKLLTVEENRAILQTQLPEAIIATYNDENLQEVVDTECNWATVIVVGPGLGQDTYVKKLVEAAMKPRKSLEGSYCPIVMDSDALNTIAKYPELEKYYGEHIVITPHVKEMSRLTQLSIEELKKDSVRRCEDYSAKHKITCLLKDATSVIAGADANTYLNISGNSALAKAGSGDVLAGIIAGMVCIGMTPWESAAYASYIHGRAGKIESQNRGKHGVIASDLLEHLKME